MPNHSRPPERNPKKRVRRSNAATTPELAADLDAFGGAPTMQVPARLLCELFNALGTDRSRNRLLEFIRRYKWIVDDRGHVAEGFTLIHDRLGFDERLYDEAVFRGKTSTRVKAAAEALEKLRDAATMVRSMKLEHTRALELSAEMATHRVVTELRVYPELEPSHVDRTIGAPVVKRLTTTSRSRRSKR